VGIVLCGKKIAGLVQKPKEEWGMEERRRNGSEVKTCIPGWAMEIER
jgi:hypothetical protein